MLVGVVVELCGGWLAIRVVVTAGVLTEGLQSRGFLGGSVEQLESSQGGNKRVEATGKSKRVRFGAQAGEEKAGMD